MKKTVITAIVGQLLGYGAFFTAIINLVFLLVQDNVLFSWWIPIGLAIGMVVAIVVSLTGLVKMLD